MVHEANEYPRPSTAEMIREFHAAMGSEPPTGPRVLDRAHAQLRLRLFEEEARELYEATMVGDLVGIADALADCVYVLYGTALESGIDLDAVLAEVHASNMTKDFSGPAGDRKAKKGPGYEPPDIARILRAETAAPVRP